MYGHLYLILNPKTINQKKGIDVIKLGKTRRQLKDRMYEHQIKNDNNILISYKIDTKYIDEAETKIRQEFKKIFTVFQGLEYFTGDKRQMILVFTDIITYYINKDLKNDDKNQILKSQNKQDIKEIPKNINNYNIVDYENEIKKLYVGDVGKILSINDNYDNIFNEFIYIMTNKEKVMIFDCSYEDKCFIDSYYKNENIIINDVILNTDWTNFEKTRDYNTLLKYNSKIHSKIDKLLYLTIKLIQNSDLFEKKFKRKTTL
jgi:hypothetical protein